MNQKSFHAHDGWTEQQGCENSPSTLPPSQTSLSIVTFTPSTWIVVMASADAANEVSKQEKKAANNNSRRTPSALRHGDVGLYYGCCTCVHTHLMTDSMLQPEGARPEAA